MTEKKLFTVTDLGGGDGGKGGIVHKLSSSERAHTVLKVGGAQGSHGVRTALGQNFNFSQFGCGTFEGARTHITELMVIEPYSLIQEGEKLKYNWGIGNIFDYLTIDAQALCITPFHTITSQLRELARQDKPKGTVGFGAGETVSDSIKHPDLALFARDFKSPRLKQILALVREQKCRDLEQIIKAIPEFPESDQKIAAPLTALLADPEFIDRIIERFNTLGDLVKVVDRDYLRHNILRRPGTVVVENSHGILTDRYYGFHPHTTRLRTTPEAILNLLSACDYDGQIIKLAVSRAYQIRHGAGPMVTESPQWLKKILPDSHKEENRWQGKVRVGPLDLVTMRYALEVCGGPKFFDGLALTWFDQIKALGKWPIGYNYEGATDPGFFLATNRIKVHRPETEGEDKQIEHQGQLTQKLFQCQANINSYDISRKDQAELIKLATQTIKDELDIPLRLISFGPTEKDKKYI
jgi:adenylosuccinate synthase